MNKKLFLFGVSQRVNCPNFSNFFKIKIMADFVKPEGKRKKSNTAEGRLRRKEKRENRQKKVVNQRNIWASWDDWD